MLLPATVRDDAYDRVRSRDIDACSRRLGLSGVFAKRLCSFFACVCVWLWRLSWELVCAKIFTSRSSALNLLFCAVEFIGTFTSRSYSRQMCLMIYGRRSPTTRAMSLCHFQFAKPLFVTPFGTLLMGLSHKTRLARYDGMAWEDYVSIQRGDFGEGFRCAFCCWGGVR